jgi:23S rRNA (cytidine1920-2'-O)/16S rRNA (cytidine1409-2'-O)-methyltransferase
VAGRTRLDRELVRRGLAPSREAAAEAVLAGRVLVGGAVASKPAARVTAGTAVALTAPPRRWASRGGDKLAPALTRLGVAVAGRRCLDAGASTGGFTDVLLQRGAALVVAVDVGYGLLDLRLRNHPRVRVLDRTNVRTLTGEQVGGQVDLVVADLSFISLTLALPALAAVTAPDPSGRSTGAPLWGSPDPSGRSTGAPLWGSPDPSGGGGDLVLLVKPQFEAGRAAVGKGGVVRDPAVRAAAVRRVAAAAAGHGLGVAGLCPSPLPGPAGNVELFLHLRAGAAPLDEAELDRAVAEGGALPGAAT